MTHPIHAAGIAVAGTLTSSTLLIDGMARMTAVALVAAFIAKPAMAPVRSRAMRWAKFVLLVVALAFAGALIRSAVWGAAYAARSSPNPQDVALQIALAFTLTIGVVLRLCLRWKASRAVA